MLTSDQGCLICLVVADDRSSASVVEVLRTWHQAELIQDLWVCSAARCTDLDSTAPVLPAMSLAGSEVPDLLHAAARDASISTIRGVFLHDADAVTADPGYVDVYRGIADTFRRALPAPIAHDGVEPYLPLHMVNLFAPLTTDEVFPTDPVARMAVPGVLLSLEDRSEPGSVSSSLRRGVNYEPHVAAGICTVAQAWSRVSVPEVRDLFLRKEDHENFPRVRAFRHMLRIARTDVPVATVADAASAVVRGGQAPPMVTRRVAPRGPAQDAMLADHAFDQVLSLQGDPTAYGQPPRTDKDVQVHALSELPGRIWRFGVRQTRETFHTASRLGVSGVLGKGQDVTLGSNPHRAIARDLPADRLAQITQAAERHRDYGQRPVIPRTEADGMPLELMATLRSQTFALIDGGAAPVTDVRALPVLTDRARSAPDPQARMLLDSDVAVALNLPDDELPFLDMWRLGGVIHQLHGMAAGHDQLPDVGGVAGRGYVEVQPAPRPGLVDADDAVYELDKCLARYKSWEDSFLGRVASRVAGSLDTAVATLKATATPLAMPDFGGALNRARKRFQIGVWAYLLSAIIGAFCFVIWGDNLTGPISRMSDIPAGYPAAAGGILPALVSGFRDVYQYQISWILTLWLGLFLAWLFSVNRYHRRQLTIDDDIAMFLLERDNLQRGRLNAENEYMRLAAVNTALSPWAEILAWVVHNPLPAPRDLLLNDDAAPDGPTLFALPHAVRVIDFPMSAKFEEIEHRRAIEREIAPGFLTRAFMSALGAAFSSEGFTAAQVLRALEQGEVGHADLRPVLLRRMRSRDLDVALREGLENRIRDQRRALVDSENEIDLLAVKVSPHETAERFLTGPLGPKIVLNNSIWRWDGQAEGAAAGEGGLGVSGEFRSAAWVLPDLPVNLANIDDVHILDLCLAGDRIQAATLRIDALQWEPTYRFTCFRQPVRVVPVTDSEEIEL